MILYVIRHGETRANKEGRLQGWTDIPLNENGVFLAEETGKALTGMRFDRCYSSPLIRARQTAELVLRCSGNPDVPIRIDERLREINMGEWEGREFRLEDGSICEEALAFFRDPFAFPGFPGGETARQVCGRTQAFLKELAMEESKDTCLIAIHGFAMRAMLNFLYEDPADFWHRHVPYNCEVDILEAEHGRLRILEENRIYYDPSFCVDRYAALKR